MKFSIIFFALIHSMFFLAQDPEAVKYNDYKEMLCIGDTLVFGNKTIKFGKVVEDSRCPKGVTCVWAGEVKILVEFYEDGNFKGDKIITGSNISIEEVFSIEDVVIKTFDVSPYPVMNKKISPEEYSLNLKISEKIETD